MDHTQKNFNTSTNREENVTPQGRWNTSMAERDNFITEHTGKHNTGKCNPTMDYIRNTHENVTLALNTEKVVTPQRSL